MDIDVTTVNEAADEIMKALGNRVSETSESEQMEKER